MNSHEEYFKNLDEIERKWQELRKNNFPLRARDDFWRLCGKGRELFWIMALEDQRQGLQVVKTAPAFQRAVMLLEHEEKYKEAIELCKEANKWKINTDWYVKRITKLQNKL